MTEKMKNYACRVASWFRKRQAGLGAYRGRDWGRKRMAILCALTWFYSASVASEERDASSDEVIRWTAGILYPWVYEDQGQFKGVLHDLVERFAHEKGAELIVKRGEAMRSMLDVVGGTSDMAIVPSSYVELASSSDEGLSPNCELNLITLRFVTIGLRDRFPDAELKQNYDQYRILARRQALTLNKGLKGIRGLELGVSSAELMLKTLLAGRVDLIIVTSADAFMGAQILGVEDRIAILDTHPEMGLNMCFSQKFLASKSEQFIEDSKKVIQGLAEDPELAQHLKETFGEQGYYRFGHIEE